MSSRKSSRTDKTGTSIDKETMTIITDYIDTSITEHITSVNAAITTSKNDIQAQLDQLNQTMQDQIALLNQTMEGNQLDVTS